MTLQFAGMTSSSFFFWRYIVCLVKFSYWSIFYVNIITGSGLRTIYFYKWLTRNLKIGNMPVWVSSNTWRLGWVRDTKFDTNVSNEILLNAAKCQGYSFCCFWVINGKPTGRGEGGGVKLPPTQIRVKECDTYCSNEEVIFNQTLRSTRNQIKCALGTLKARWQIL